MIPKDKRALWARYIDGDLLDPSEGPWVVKTLLDHAEEMDALVRRLAVGMEKARAGACRCGDRECGAALHSLLMAVPEDLWHGRETR